MGSKLRKLRVKFGVFGREPISRLRARAREAERAARPRPAQTKFFPQGKHDELNRLLDEMAARYGVRREASQRGCLDLDLFRELVVATGTDCLPLGFHWAEYLPPLEAKAHGLVGVCRVCGKAKETAAYEAELYDAKLGKERRLAPFVAAGDRFHVYDPARSPRVSPPLALAAIETARLRGSR